MYIPHIWSVSALHENGIGYIFSILSIVLIWYLTRAIRHKMDYGAILLMDSRYATRQNVYDSIPNWIKKSYVKCDSFSKAFPLFCKFMRSMKSQNWRPIFKILVLQTSPTPSLLLNDHPLFLSSVHSLHLLRVEIHQYLSLLLSSANISISWRRVLCLRSVTLSIWF